MSDTQRIDIALCELGKAASRAKAQSLIKGGYVYINDQQITKCSVSVSEEDVIEVRGDDCPYVSRGALKLAKAIRTFEIEPAGRVCVDIGASTGGFTDVLLKNGAEKVYAVDVGTSQLADVIRNDPRVVVMEQTNARNMGKEMFRVLPSLAVMDVSFISILLILPALRQVMEPDSVLISLIKPQFEAGRSSIGKNGIVSDAKVHERVLKELSYKASEIGWTMIKADYSPITGSDGNIEFLSLFCAGDVPAKRISDNYLHNLVCKAHKELK